MVTPKRPLAQAVNALMAVAGADLAVLGVGPLVVRIMTPPSRAYPPVNVPGNTQFWGLSTGSRIAGCRERHPAACDAWELSRLETPDPWG